MERSKVTNSNPPGLLRSLLTKIVVGLPLLLCLLALAGVNGSAYAATTQATHCQVILQKAATREAFSPTLSTSCSAQPLALLGSAIPLITLYSQPGFQGKTITYYGYQGPCDDVGYHIRYTGGLWDHIVSGFRPGAGCGGVRLYTDRNMQGTCYAFWEEMGDLAPYGMANNVKSLQVSDAFVDCNGTVNPPAPLPFS